MGEMRELAAPAKINLHLSVGKVRPDGFHSIESVFCKIGLMDRLYVEFQESKTFQLDVFGLEKLCGKGTDSISQAGRLWYESTGKPLAITVHCEKKIPVRAGLGGGSSDAASFLDVLQELYPVQPEKLMEIATEVGSDVPFFVSKCTSAWVTGRGEVIQGIETRRYFVCLVMPMDFSSETCSAYRQLDMFPRDDGPSKERVLEALGGGSASFGEILYNDFFKIVGHMKFYREIATLAEGLQGFGSLTGSGACYYFLSEKEDQVRFFQQGVNEKMRDAQRNWITCIL